MPTAHCQIDHITCLNLEETFECGQCFRWNPSGDGGYTGILGKYAVTLQMQGDRLLI